MEDHKEKITVTGSKNLIKSGYMATLCRVAREEMKKREEAEETENLKKEAENPKD